MSVQIVLVGSDRWRTSLRRCWRFVRLRMGRKKHNKAYTIEINLKRAICFSVFMALLLYFGGALGLYAWRAQQPHNQITYWDFLQAPINPGRLFEKQGKMQILQARDDLKKEKYKEAFFKYRSGVRRVPQDQEARLELAQFFIAWDMNVRATDLLVEGLEFGYPGPAYLQTLTRLCQYTGNHPALLRAIPKILEYPKVQEDKDFRVALNLLLLRAQLVEGDFTGVIETADLLNHEDIGKTFYDTALYAYLRMGSYDDAQIYLDTLSPELLQQPNIILLVGSLKQALDEEAEARKIFYSLFRDFPTAWRSHMDAILMLYGNRDRRAADSLLDLYLSMHRRNTEAITTISAQFTDMPDARRVRKIMNYVRVDAPELLGSLWFYYVQALVTEGEFEKAKVEMDKLSPARPKDPKSATVFETYSHILDAALSSNEGEYNKLVNYTETNRLTEELYWEAAEAMRKVGALQAAEFILNAGLTEFPFSRSMSALRNRVLKEQADSDLQSRRVVASVKESGYEDQSIKSDPMQRRLVGEEKEVSAGLESLVGDEKLKDIEISEEEIDASQYQ